ncbi:MAG: hypothetical protein HWN65_15635 [Candidatus Helarchaeota archaeon]|nr:hypothetical protein [Candidatus Helarchaeota archaeon]
MQNTIKKDGANLKEHLHFNLSSHSFGQMGLFTTFCGFYPLFLMLVGNTYLMERIIVVLINFLSGLIGLSIFFSVIQKRYYNKEKMKFKDHKISSPFIADSYSLIVFLIVLYFYPVTLVDWGLTLITLFMVLIYPSPKRALLPRSIHRFCLITMENGDISENHVAELYSMITAGLFMQGIFSVLCFLQVYPVLAILTLFLQRPIYSYYKNKQYKVEISERIHENNFEKYKYNFYENEYEKDKLYRIGFYMILFPVFFIFIFMIFGFLFLF